MRARRAEDRVAIRHRADAVHHCAHPACDLAVAAAHGEYRELAAEGNESLEDARDIAEPRPGGIELGRLPENDLPLSVVASAPGLQHRGQTDRVDCGAQVGDRVDGLE